MKGEVGVGIGQYQHKVAFNYNVRSHACTQLFCLQYDIPYCMQGTANAWDLENHPLSSYLCPYLGGSICILSDAILISHQTIDPLKYTIVEV